MVLSHLHFDHCGQQAALDAPVYVQTVEHEAAQAEGYTVPEWAAIPAHRLRLVDGDEEIADGVILLATPGHTPGHQSVLIEAGTHRVVLAAQCAFTGTELRSGEPSPTNLHDETWAEPARRSLQRLRDLAPVTCHLSHDPDTSGSPEPERRHRSGDGDDLDRERGAGGGVEVDLLARLLADERLPEG